MTRKGKIADMDRSFDYEYWQKLTVEARMTAVWEMTVFHHELKGGSVDELRLDRTAVSLQSV